MTIDKLIETVEAITKGQKVVMDFQMHSWIQRIESPGLGNLNAFASFLRIVKSAEDPVISERNPK